MGKSRICLPALLLAGAACSAHALDRLHFRGMSEQDFKYVASAFQQVNVYYLVTSAGNSILTRMTRPHPKVNGLTNNGLVAYFNPKDAEVAKRDREKTMAIKIEVRSAKATNMLQAQFSRRNAPPSEDKDSPDFIILLSHEPKIDVIEHLVSKSNVPLSIKTKDGKDVILAFMDAAYATRQQQGLAARGQPVDRIGQDERTFLGFILAQARQGRFVLVRGFE
jgi:hypothetical protein